MRKSFQNFIQTIIYRIRENQTTVLYAVLLPIHLNLAPFQQVEFPKVSQSQAPLKHTILIFTAANNDLENSCLSDQQKLLQSEIHPNTAVHQLIETKNHGSYRVRIHGADPEHVRTVPIERPNMTDPETLRDFIQQAVKDSPAENYSSSFKDMAGLLSLNRIGITPSQPIAFEKPLKAVECISSSSLWTLARWPVSRPFMN